MKKIVLVAMMVAAALAASTPALAADGVLASFNQSFTLDRGKPWPLDRPPGGGTEKAAKPLLDQGAHVVDVELTEERIEAAITHINRTAFDSYPAYQIARHANDNRVRYIARLLASLEKPEGSGAACDVAGIRDKALGDAAAAVEALRE
jgi:hypothetical protein